MSYLLPSDPVTSRYPDITAEQREEIRRQMGLDQPLPVQYARYMQSVFRGDFGTSYNTGNRVIDDLKDRLPATLELAAFRHPVRHHSRAFRSVSSLRSIAAAGSTT